MQLIAEKFYDDRGVPVSDALYRRSDGAFRLHERGEGPADRWLEISPKEVEEWLNDLDEVAPVASA